LYGDLGPIHHQIDMAHMGVLVSIFPQHPHYEECANARLFSRLMVEHMRGMDAKHDQIELRAIERKEKRKAA
jgi:hypothetical protein